MEQHIYTSSKGDFLSFQEWVDLNATAAEKVIYEDEENTDEKKALYAKWVKAEQIVTHKCVYDDGTELEFPSPLDA